MNFYNSTQNTITVLICMPVRYMSVSSIRPETPVCIRKLPPILGLVRPASMQL